MLAAIMLVVLAGCAGPARKAPVEDRSPVAKAPAAAEPAASAAEAAPKPLPGIENAGKPGYYTVKPGDTLIEARLTAEGLRTTARLSSQETVPS